MTDMTDRALAFVDTETTSLNDPYVIEICVDRKESIFVKRFKNPVPIDIEAMAVHHITPGMISHLPFFRDDPDYGLIKEMLESSIFIAHNAKFDIGALANDGIEIKNSIDTKRVAMHLYPDLPSHSLQYLRYYLECYLTQEESVAHSADGDVRVLIAVWNKMLEKAGSLEKILELSQTPALMQRINFGKHSGETFAEINQLDRPYIEYLWKQKMVDRGEDFLYTVDYWMHRRSA